MVDNACRQFNQVGVEIIEVLPDMYAVAFEQGDKRSARRGVELENYLNGFITIIRLLVLLRVANALAQVRRDLVGSAGVISAAVLAGFRAGSIADQYAEGGREQQRNCDAPANHS